MRFTAGPAPPARPPGAVISVSAIFLQPICSQVVARGPAFLESDFASLGSNPLYSCFFDSQTAMLFPYFPHFYDQLTYCLLHHKDLT